MKKLVELLKEKKKTISTMESCTGGGLVNEITNIEGASEILKFSAITYSNEFKIKMGVNAETIRKHTVYSIETAKEMSKAISTYTNSDYGIGITGKLNKEDENNPYNDNNKVFISIYDKENNKYYTKEIYVNEKTRVENKQIIIKEIEKLVLSIII